MKKWMRLSALLLALLLLAGCGQSGKLDLPPVPTRPAVEQPEVSAEPAEEPERPAEPATEAEEPAREQNPLGPRVLVGIKNNTEIFYAPDDSAQRILTFGYDTATVRIEGREEAAERINHILAVKEENYYSGTGAGDGLNGLLEQATDNYSMVRETESDLSVEYSSLRSATVPRADSRVVSLKYTTQTYTGGAHGFYFDRGYVFSAATGELLSLQSLCEDYEAFADFLYEQIRVQTENSEGRVDLLPEDAESALRGLLRQGQWYFDNDGLVIFSDLYEIASYAAGIIDFHIPYDALAPYIDEAYLPVERVGDGSLSLMRQNEVPAGSVPILDKVTVDKNGEELSLRAEGTVYDVILASVSYIDDSTRFYQTAEHWTCSYMDDCAIQLITAIPEGMPDLMIRCTLSGGETHSFLISQSGEDGSLILIDDSIEAVG